MWFLGAQNVGGPEIPKIGYLASLSTRRIAFGCFLEYIGCNC